MKRNTRPITDTQINEIVDLYKSGMSVLKIEKQLGISESTIYRSLWSRNIPRTAKNMINRKHIVNEEYFNNIDSEKKAYFLGLLFADGTNDGRKKLTIRLQEEDGYILTVLKDEISPTNKLLYLKSRCDNCKPQLSLDIYSGNLCRNLSNIGCIPKKSKGMDFPNIIPNEYLNHFVRGYFDGDGSVNVKDKNGKYSRVFVASFTSCYSFLKVLKEKLEILGFKISKINMDGRNDYTASFNIHGFKNLESFYDWMYKDSTVFLKRKELKFKKIKTWNIS
jgi:intein-encoded DNA endonuclease-like protein